MGPRDRIYVAGHRGLVGSALVRRLRAGGYRDLLLRTHLELDLLDGAAVRRFFEVEKPDHVLFAAARVGGIHANETFPAEFVYQNLLMQTHAIHESWRSEVKRFLFLGSSCIYPRECPQPMREDYLLAGPLEPTNRAYAVAKIAGIETCWSYNRQYGTQYLAVMPTNLFGEGDNYDLKTSHVLPALIRKMHEAREKGSPFVEVWGTGRPRREFLYSDDMADACLFLMTLPKQRFGELVHPDRLPLVNIGAGKDITIAELARKVAEVVGYQGELIFDTSQPDGAPRKLLDVSYLASIGWISRISLRRGIEMAYAHFKTREALSA